MKKIKKHSRKIALLLGSLVLFVSCSNNEVLAIPAVDTQGFSDLEIFQGVFFMEGKLAEEVPSIDSKYMLSNVSKMGQEDRQKYEEFADYIESYLLANHKTELEEFGKLMRSGSHAKVMKAMKDISAPYLMAISEHELYGKYFDKAYENIKGFEVSLLRNSDGTFNKEMFEENIDEITKNVESILSKSTTDSVVAINFVTVFVAAAAVLVAVVAGVVVAIGVVAVVVAAVEVGVVTDDELDDDPQAKGVNLNSMSLHQELLINDLVEVLSK